MSCQRNLTCLYCSWQETDFVIAGTDNDAPAKTVVSAPQPSTTRSTMLEFSASPLDLSLFGLDLTTTDSDSSTSSTTLAVTISSLEASESIESDLSLTEDSSLPSFESGSTTDSGTFSELTSDDFDSSNEDSSSNNADLQPFVDITSLGSIDSSSTVSYISSVNVSATGSVKPTSNSAQDFSPSASDISSSSSVDIGAPLAPFLSSTTEYSSTSSTLSSVFSLTPSTTTTASPLLSLFSTTQPNSNILPPATTLSPEQFEAESSKIINEVQNTISGIIKNVVASKQNETQEQNLDDIVRQINEAIPSEIALKALEVDETELKSKIKETVGELLTDREIESVVRLRNKTRDITEFGEEIKVLNSRVEIEQSSTSTPSTTLPPALSISTALPKGGDQQIYEEIELYDYSDTTEFVDIPNLQDSFIEQSTDKGKHF